MINGVRVSRFEKKKLRRFFFVLTSIKISKTAMRTTIQILGTCDVKWQTNPWSIFAMIYRLAHAVVSPVDKLVLPTATLTLIFSIDFGVTSLP